MSKIQLKCYVDMFEVIEVDSFGQEFPICSFYSYDGDSFDGFIKFLEVKDFAYEVVDMEDL